MLDDGHGPSGVVESREKDFLSHELQEDKAREENPQVTNGNGTSRSEPAAQTAKALVTGPRELVHGG